MRRNFELLTRFLANVGRRFVDDDGFNLAASLTYTTLLAIVPLVTIALTVFSAFPAFGSFTRGINEFIAQNMLPPSVAQTITGYVDQFTRSAAGLTAVGLVFLAVTAIMLMQTIEGAFNRIWRVRRPRSLMFRVLTYWSVLTLGPLLIGAGLSMTSYLVSTSLGYAHQIPGAATLVLALVPVVLTALAFTLLYWVVPNRRVLLWHAFVGGLLAAVMFEGMKRGFALYISSIPSYARVYGTFAAIPIFLLWIYLSWLVAVLGAVVTAALPDWGAGRSGMERSLAMQYRDALSVLRVLIEAQQGSTTLDTRQIVRSARIPVETCEMLLDRLSREGWVMATEGGRWALACDPDLVTLAEVYERLIFRTARVRRMGDPEVVEAAISRAASALEQALHQPIRVLADGPSAPAQADVRSRH